MKCINEGVVKVGDILWTGGRQYFYVHNIVNGIMDMSGVGEIGFVFIKRRNCYSALYIMETQEERKKFFDLIEKYNLKFNKNRGVYR